MIYSIYFATKREELQFGAKRVVAVLSLVGRNRCVCGRQLNMLGLFGYCPGDTCNEVQSICRVYVTLATESASNRLRTLGSLI